MERITRGTGLIGGLNIGGQDTLLGLKVGTVSINPASLATVTKAGTAVTLTGVAAGDFVALMPPSDLEAGLLYTGCAITDDDEVTVYLYNPTGSSVDGAAKNWTYLWLDLTE